MTMKIEETYKEIPLPSEIMNFLKKQNGIYEYSRNNTFSITELLSCKRNVFFKKSRFPKDVHTPTVSELWPSVRGNLLHNLGEAYSWNELEGSMEVTLENNQKIKICGRLDMYDHTTKTIIDLKTISDVKSSAEQNLLPLKEHVMQVQAYYTIFSKFVPVEHLNLVYADSKDMKNYEIPIMDITNWIENRSSSLQKYLSTLKLPVGEVSGKCKFCKYQKICLEKGGGINEENYRNQKFD